jgi:hypothetical protein
MQRAQLVAAAREAEGDEAAVRRRIEPVDRDETILRVRVDEDAVVRRSRLPQVQDRLILVRRAPEVKGGAGGQARRLEQADLQRLVKPRADAAAERNCVERRARRRVLLVGPAPHLWRVGLLQPAVRVVDLDAVKRLAHGV